MSTPRKALLLSVTLIFLGLIASTAEADTITFNSVLQTTYGPDRANLTTQGFLFSSDGHLHTNESFGFTDDSLGGFVTAASNGTIYANAHDGSTITMQMENAAPFSLNGFDAAEHIGAANSFRNAMQITITGFLHGGGIVMQTFTLDGVTDGPGGAADFQTFMLEANFTNPAVRNLFWHRGHCSGIFHRQHRRQSSSIRDPRTRHPASVQHRNGGSCRESVQAAQA